MSASVTLIWSVQSQISDPNRLFRCPLWKQSNSIAVEIRPCTGFYLTLDTSGRTRMPLLRIRGRTKQKTQGLITFLSSSLPLLT